MTRWISRGTRTLARGVALFGLWMVFVDNAHQPEMVTGAVVAAAAAILGTLVAVARREPSRLSLSMFRHVYRPLLLLVSDTVRVFGALVRQLSGHATTGRFRAVRYRAVDDDPDSRARRILTEWGASLAANRYVVGIDPEGGYLLVHELVPSSGPLDPLELG